MISDPSILNHFNLVKPHEFDGNAVKLIGFDWMLLTAGNRQSFNTMTASWGSIGMLWNKPVVFVFIRPQRHTFSFFENNETFTCSFFDSSYRKELELCGKVSGRNHDKVKETGLTPINVNETMAFHEASIILECKKIYTHIVNPMNFIEPDIQKHYPEKDYHKMYIGEIKTVLVKSQQ